MSVQTENTETYNLRQYRTDSGLGIDTILEKGQELTPAFPTTAEHLYNIERRGTTNYHLVLAFAAIYGKSPADIVAPAKR